MLCGAGPAPADEDHLQARALVEAGVILPLERILDQVAAEHPGRVLEVEFEREQGRYVYEIELVDDRGRVWELEYDAENAKLLEKERED
ncbi:MAG TPA: peptidase [Sedimenticola sp.]|nr:peptidase [Sedimenticola sp.]